MHTIQYNTYNTDVLGCRYTPYYALGHYAIFSATLLLQLHSTPSLMLILSLMKLHHIGDSTISSP